jgi:hypothetical protein
VKRVPASVRAVEVAERRLAWGVCADGTALVASPVAFYAGSSRLPWVDIERAGWTAPVLTVVEAAEVEGAGAVHIFEVVEDKQLAETVRACVLSSVVWSDRRSFGAAGSVRLVGRRVPGQEVLTWQQVWAPGTDRFDPAVRAKADAWVLELRKTIG